MLRNYLLAAIRSIRKQLTYSVINVVGLGMGLTTGMLLLLWVTEELSYDRFHEKANRIYRASMEYSFGGQTSSTSVSPTALLPTLQKNFPDIEDGVRVYNQSAWSPYIVRQGDKLFQEKRFYFADSTFFKVFSFRLLQGNPDKALSDPATVVLTQSMARKYFGNEDALGKTLTVNDKKEYLVTGIMEDLPSNSLLQFDCVASFQTLGRETTWWSANYQTFVLARPDADIHDIADKTNQLVAKELASELTGKGDYVRYRFMPLTDIYLRSNLDEPEVTGSIQYVYVMGAIALLVLLIAGINYVNLATARAADRAREVGVRKVAGAARTQLFTQFISESVLIALIGFAAALAASALALPLFNELSSKHFTISDLLDTSFLLKSTAIVLVVGLAAGVYPAVVLTSFQPSHVLKGNFRNSSRGIVLRQSLVVFQFAVSVILMVGTLVITKQLGFIQSKALGYDKEHVLILPLDQKTSAVYDQLKTELVRSGAVTSVARASESPTKVQGGYGINVEGRGNDRGTIITAMTVDKELVPTMGMELITGRNFTEADQLRWEKDTTNAFILNETALKEMHINLQEAVGTRINLSGRRGEIIGVVKDFHFSSMHEAITPLAMFIEPWQFLYAFVKLQPGNIQEHLEKVRTIATGLAPHRPFDYQFLDVQYEKMYDKEQRMGTIAGTFTAIAIVIACLGLLGLVAFAAAQKTKEIGIRKVLGATSGSIVVLITRDYTRLVLIAVVLALPLAYWLMDSLWLSSFVYRTTIGALPLVTAAAVSILIAFGTSLYQALRAARIDPARTLRSE
ncbi:MAG: ABC transporter permease [Cyclobacteriaceae bacterium]|nr:ABC transporter permease [Cyclobacteriaceae bacterium]